MTKPAHSEPQVKPQEKEGEMGMDKKLEWFSKAPLNSWPRAGINLQIALIHGKLFGIPILDAMEIAQEYEQEEAILFISANADLMESSNN